jgi:hypothetical protein
MWKANGDVQATEVMRLSFLLLKLPSSFFEKVRMP